MNKDFQHFIGFNGNNIQEHFESKFNKNYMEHMYCGKLIKCGYDKQPKTSEDGVSFYFRECAKNPEEYDYQILKDEHTDITNTIKCLNRKVNNPETCEKDKSTMREMIGCLYEDLHWLEGYMKHEDRTYRDKINEEHLKKLRDLNCNEGIHPDGLVKFPDSYSFEEEVCWKDLSEDFKDWIEMLFDDVQRKCLVLYFYENMTQASIAKKLNIRQQLVSENIQNCLEILREHITYKYIIDYIRDSR